MTDYCRKAQPVQAWVVDLMLRGSIRRRPGEGGWVQAGLLIGDGGDPAAIKILDWIVLDKDGTVSSYTSVQFDDQFEALDSAVGAP